MMFERLSEYIRDKKGLQKNWRVYSVELMKSGKVKCIGALTRSVDVEFEPDIGREYDWIKPLTGKAQMTISLEVYNAELGVKNDMPCKICGASSVSGRGCPF